MRGRGIWKLHGMAGERQKRDDDEDDAVWRRGPRKEGRAGGAGRGEAAMDPNRNRYEYQVRVPGRTREWTGAHKKEGPEIGVKPWVEIPWRIRRRFSVRAAERVAGLEELTQKNRRMFRR
jgi:hypothetical protein